MTSKDQKIMLEKEIERAKCVSGQLLKNPLDALRNVHYAKNSLELKINEARKRNEIAQKKHQALLIEYYFFVFYVKKSIYKKKLSKNLL